MHGITSTSKEVKFDQYLSISGMNEKMNLTAITDEEGGTSKVLHDSLALSDFIMNWLTKRLRRGVKCIGIPLKIVFPDFGKWRLVTAE